MASSLNCLSPLPVAQHVSCNATNDDLARSSPCLDEQDSSSFPLEYRSYHRPPHWKGLTVLEAVALRGMLTYTFVCRRPVLGVCHHAHSPGKRHFLENLGWRAVDLSSGCRGMRAGLRMVYRVEEQTVVGEVPGSPSL